MTFTRTPFSLADQYIFYQFLYQGGIFLSRSSVNLFQVRWLWAMALLQVANLVLLSLEARLQFIPSIYIVFVIVFFEGLLGGLTYVNAFWRIHQEVATERREFAMGVVSLADSTGIFLAAVVGLFVNHALCTARGNCERSTS